MAQNTSSAVMSQRSEPADSLDFFPTPPWATRALCEHLDCWGAIGKDSAWDPACGQGHMVRPLREYFARVHASDVHAYGGEQECQRDFLIPWAAHDFEVDWVITNPPFRLAEEFVLRGLEVARTGVAMLVRTAFLEGVGRHGRLFGKRPPEWILQFTERVPMAKGRLDPKGSTATAYCWVVWVDASREVDAAAWCRCGFPAFDWLSPCRARLERPGDYGGPA